MLALIKWIRRSFPGWTKLVTHEGVKVLFPEYPARKCSQSESPLGSINVTFYSAGLANTNFSAILSIREYAPVVSAQPDDYFKDWSDEFKHTMEITGMKLTLLKEKRIEDKHPRHDLLFCNFDETVFTRVSLISKGNRLVILFAVGMLQEVSGPACSECFQSIRL